MAYIINVNRKTNSYTLRRTVRKITVNRVGKRGKTGADGKAATIQVGSTTTLPAGSSATVANTGTDSDAVFNFGIPQGAKGDPGDPATNLVISVNGRDGAVTGLAEKAELDMVEEELYQDLTQGDANTLELAKDDAQERVDILDESLATVAKTGSYDDLVNKPVIPTPPVTSVNGRTGAVTGLAEKAELDMVEEELFQDIQTGDAATIASANSYTDTKVAGVTKASIGLGNVDNTSDLNKPVSTAQANAIENNNQTVYFGYDPSVQRPTTDKPVMWSGASGITPVNAIPNFDIIFTYTIDSVPNIGWKATYDASSVTTVIDGSLLSSWNDSTSGYDAVQSVESRKPVWRASDTLFNNKAIVDFSAGANRHLLTSPWPTDSQPNTIVFVGTIPLLSGAVQRIVVDGRENGLRNAVGRWSNGSVGIFGGSAAVEIAAGIDDAPHLVIAVVNGLSSKLIIDGVSYSTPSNPGSNPLTGLTIGSRMTNYIDGFMGKLGFVGVLPGAISDQDASSLLAWAKGVYDI